ncbi:flagellar protein FlaG [Bacillus weihaiensis]|uniref:flagellar protein FlaG n=1 Tax=Bacillus weihaiensis TaxID=1547283 RepID=UPI0023555330|nr:flagellar protein FlaG [Bacillus weihaiensis]
MSVEKLSSQSALHIQDQTKITISNANNEYLDEQVNHRQIIPTKSEMEHVIEGLNEVLQPLNTHIKFELHEKLNEYYVTVVDDITNEVVREIPSKKWLDIYAAMTDFVGLIVDQKI